MAARGITISVTAETNPGCRKHMEDYLAVKLSPTEELSQAPHLREQAYIGVFDGHGGKEAAKCARERLWDIIQSQPKYRLSDLASVKESLEEAFVALHSEMEPLRGEVLRTGENTYQVYSVECDNRGVCIMLPLINAMCVLATLPLMCTMR